MQGEEAHFFYVVYEGQFAVALNSGGRETLIHTYSAGDHANSSFGELALTSGRPHAAKVVAKTDGQLQLPPLCQAWSESCTTLNSFLVFCQA